MQSFTGRLVAPAETAEEAKQIAQVTLGPLVMLNSECIRLEREGPGGPAALEVKNRELAKKLADEVTSMDERLKMLQWERDQIQTLTQFLVDE